jgi:hypothetical protein
MTVAERTISAVFRAASLCPRYRRTILNSLCPTGIPKVRGSPGLTRIEIRLRPTEEMKETTTKLIMAEVHLST